MQFHILYPHSDSYGAPTAPLVQEAVQSAPSYDGAWYPEQAQPVPSYNAGKLSSLHLGFSTRVFEKLLSNQLNCTYLKFSLGFNYQQPNFKAPVACVDNGLAGFGANFLTTAIQVMLGLFAFSLLISVRVSVIGKNCYLFSVTRNSYVL